MRLYCGMILTRQMALGRIRKWPPKTPLRISSSSTQEITYAWEIRYRNVVTSLCELLTPLILRKGKKLKRITHNSGLLFQVVKSLEMADKLAPCDSHFSPTKKCNDAPPPSLLISITPETLFKCDVKSCV